MGKAIELQSHMIWAECEQNCKINNQCTVQSSQNKEEPTASTNIETLNKIQRIKKVPKLRVQVVRNANLN